MIDVEKFRKVWALTSSLNTNEAKVALSKAQGMLAAAGKTLADVPGLLARHTTTVAAAGHGAWATRPPPPSYEDLFGSRDKHRARQAERRRVVVARYGSEKAVLADTPMEAAVGAAIGGLRRKVWKDFDNGRFEIDSLDGWTNNWINKEVMPESVRAAVTGAMPLPGTVTEAYAELRAWQDRENDLQHFHGDECGDTAVSLASEARWDLVRALFWTDLPARSVEDVALRFAELVDEGHGGPPGAENRIKADLAALAANAQPSARRTDSSLTAHDLRSRLCCEVTAAGGPAAWGAQHGLPRGYVFDVESARRPPSERILAALGLRREVRFTPAGKPRTKAPGEPGRLVAFLTREDRLTLAWLPGDGAPRDRRVRDGWRPGTDALRRLERLGLAVPDGEGWAATAQGQTARVAIDVESRRG